MTDFFRSGATAPWPIAVAIDDGRGRGWRPSVAADMTAEEIIAASGVTDDTSFCGTKPITLGIHDGFGVNGWSKSSMAAVRSEAAKCPNVKQVVRIGQGDLQKSIADVNGLVAEGIDALVIIPDFGKAQLPSIKAATDAGVKVVAWAADPGGKPGEDYVAYVDWDQVDAGAVWAEWMAKALGGKGNIIFLGGPPGNPVSANSLAGIKTALEKYPDITMLTGYDDWPVTNWDAALLQKTLTALLSKYAADRRHHQRQRRLHRSRRAARLRGRRQAAGADRHARGQRVRLRIRQAEADQSEARIRHAVGPDLDGPGRRAQGDRRRGRHREQRADRLQAAGLRGHARRPRRRNAIRPSRRMPSSRSC